MALYRRITTVEARQYHGSRITVVHDSLGEQTANAGDWLLGTERGKIEVMSNAKFIAEFKPAPQEPKAKSKNTQIEAA